MINASLLIMDFTKHFAYHGDEKQCGSGDPCSNTKGTAVHSWKVFSRCCNGFAGWVLLVLSTTLEYRTVQGRKYMDTVFLVLWICCFFVGLMGGTCAHGSERTSSSSSCQAESSDTVRFSCLYCIDKLCAGHHSCAHRSP